MIYCCFHATGKTTLSRKNSRFIDLDIPYLGVDEIVNLALENENCGKIPLLPMWGILRQELNKRQIKYKIIYPDISLKEEYINRINKRNKSSELEESLQEHWDILINGFKQSSTESIVLNSKQYLENILNHEHDHTLSR